MKTLWVTVRARWPMRLLGFQPFIRGVHFGSSGHTVDGYDVPAEDADTLLSILAEEGLWAHLGVTSKAQRAL